MNRGAQRDPIFGDDTDRELFLSTLADAHERWGVETHAFALMGNHFHLLVRDEDGLLSRAMRHVCGVHTLRFNRRHERDGSLFRGRFRSRLVQTDEYLAELVRYIHANPLAIEGVERASDYAWSSHRHYLSRPSARPPWLHTEAVFQRVGGDSPSGRRRLDVFVHERMPPEVQELIESKRWAPVLGTPEFVDVARQAAREQGHADPTRPHRRFASQTPSELVDIVASCMGVAPQLVRTGTRGQTNVARQLAVLLCVDHSPATASEIGDELGMRRTSVPTLAHHIRAAVRGDAELRASFARVLEAAIVKTSAEDG